MQSKPDAALWNQTFGPQQEAYITLNTLSGSPQEIELILRNQGNTDECEAILVSINTFSGSRVVEVSYCTGGVFTPVGSTVPVPSIASGDLFWARGYDDGTVEVYLNGNKLGTWDASAAPMGKSGGRIGIYLYNLPEQIKLDDFGGGSF